MEAAVDFIYLVRERFILEPSKFREFAQYLSALTRTTCLQDHVLLVWKLKNLFVDHHQDLLLALDHFIPRNMVFEKQDDDDDDKYSWLLTDSANVFFNKIRDRCMAKNDKEFSVLIKFSELIVACHQRRITAKEADSEFQVLFKDNPDVDLYIESTHFLADLWEEEECYKKPGLDYSSVGFLNKWGKVVRKPSEYDKTMLVKEFYLDEIKLVLARMESAIVKLDGDPETFGECFSVHDCKCIVELYEGGDCDDSYGEQVLEILRSDPVGRIVARQVVQERLRKKRLQLYEQKLRLDQVWKEIFEDIRKGDAHARRHTDFLQQMTDLSKTNYST